MRFEVYLTRSNGRLLQRHQRSSKTWVGHFDMKEIRHPDLNRITRVAQLVTDEGGPVEGLPPLMDAILLAAHKGWWSLAGYERIEEQPGRFVDYAQSWVMTPLDESQP